MEEFLVIFFSSVKFGLTFPLAIIEYNLGFMETILWTNVGGLIGILVFAFLSEQLLFLWRNYLWNFLQKLFNISREKVKTKKIFTKKNRRIVKIKSKYGLAGIALSTPILLSIPLGVFLTIRYFNHKKYKLLYLLGGNIIWSFLYASFYSSFWEYIKG